MLREEFADMDKTTIQDAYRNRKNGIGKINYTVMVGEWHLEFWSHSMLVASSTVATRTKSWGVFTTLY